MSYITNKGNSVEIQFDNIGVVKLYDTADADVTAEDLKTGIIAYGAKGRIVGTYEAPDLSLADVTAEDIRRGKIAFGPNGILTGVFDGVDTSDADATANDIVVGKTAYVNGEKLTGVFEGVDTSDADATSSDIASGKTAYVDGVKITGTANIESPNWFKVTNLSDEEMYFNISSGAPCYLWYSLDDGANWQWLVINDGANRNILIAPYGTLYLDGRGDRNDVGNYSFESVRFHGDKSFKISGDLSTLTYKYPSKISYGYLFQNNENLIYADELILPWLGLDDRSFEYFFANCTNLQTAPVLPAKYLRSGTYNFMFYNCTSLTTAPDLSSAEEVYASTFQGMFQDCTSLINPPSDLTNVQLDLQGALFENMFRGCSSLTSLPEFRNYDSYVGQDVMSGIFSNCTSLQNVEIFLTHGYGGAQFAFAGCTSLKSAHIKNTQIYTGGVQFRDLFSGCINLSFVQCDVVEGIYGEQELQAGDFEGWLNNVAPFGILKVPATMVSFYRDNNLIPAGWIITTTEPAIEISPDAWNIGEISTIGTVSQTFTLTNIDPSDTSWTWRSNSTDANYTYSVSGNTITVSYTTNAATANHVIDNRIVFEHSEHSAAVLNITGEVRFPDIETNLDAIAFDIDGGADTSTLLIYTPGCNYTLSSSNYITVVPDAADNTRLIINYDGLATTPEIATLTLSKIGYSTKELIIAVGDEIAAHGCYKVEYIQTNGQREYLNTGVLLPEDSTIILDTEENTGGQGNYTLSTRWANNESDYTNYYLRVFTTGTGFFWDLVSDNDRFSFTPQETLDQNRYTMILYNKRTEDSRHVELEWYNSQNRQSSGVVAWAYGPQNYPLLWANYVAEPYELWNISTPGEHYEEGITRKLYSLKVVDTRNGGNVEIFNAVPVVRFSDNKPGVYDYITQEFYPCCGPVDMTYGPAV